MIMSVLTLASSSVLPSHRLDSGLKTSSAITVAGAVGVLHPFPHHFPIILVEVYHRTGNFSIEYFSELHPKPSI